MTRYAVFLRGINLAGRRAVPMARLREVCEQAGGQGVRTLLQSGNVVLSSGQEPRALEATLEAVLSEAFGFEIPVLVRTRDELAAVLAADPFGSRADDPSRYQVSFLTGELEPAAVRALAELARAPEEVVVRGREVHAWHPGGVGRSDLAKAISERRLGVGVTARNRRTLRSLLELLDEN